MQPSPPLVNAAQPLPVPLPPPPTIPDEVHPVGWEDETPYDVNADRRARRRALFVRLLGVLGILVVAGFAAVTVGRAWLRSLPSVVWPAALERPKTPELPRPIGPENEPVLPAPSLEPPVTPREQAAPPVETSESERHLIVPGRAEPLPSTTNQSEPSGPTGTTPAAPSPRGPRATPARELAPLPPEPVLPPERRHDRMAPEDLPAAPTVDPASPQAPPAGEEPPASSAPSGDDSPRIPADEGNEVFGED